MSAVAVGDAVQGAVELIHTEADGAGKLVVQSQEFGDLPAGDHANEGFQIGFHAATGTQHGHPLGDVGMAADLFAAGKEDVVFDVEHAGCGVGALEVFSKLEKIPAVAVKHGGIRRALQGMEPVHQPAVKINRAVGEVRPG